jgi:hypothetical protein
MMGTGEEGTELKSSDWVGSASGGGLDLIGGTGTARGPSHGCRLG